MSAQPTDAGTAAIGLAFGAGVSAGGGIGEGAADMAAFGAGLTRRLRRQAMPFNLPPGLLPANAPIGAYLDIPPQFGPPNGWFWDITALAAYGFTAGSIAISKNAPIVTAAGNPYAIEPVGSFTQAGVLTYPQRGMPLLDSSERLVFCVTSALTGQAQISGQVIAVPAERIDEYLT
jgi:hypothetical protein